MNKFNRMTDGATRHFAWHAAWLPQVFKPAHLQQLTALSHKSLMWLVMLLAAFVAGCGGGGGSTPDTTAPTVISTSPANAASGVAASANITATFSEAMDSLTINATTFTLKKGGILVPGVVTYAGTTATFNPTSNLAASTTYTATVTTGVKDLASNSLAVIKTWSFNTAADATPPTVSSTVPVDGATAVALNANVTATFSKAMDPLTITTTTFTLAQGATSITGVVTSPSTTTATFNPAANLAASTTYTATITTGVKDLAGNAMLATKTWSFTTGTAAVAGVAPVDLGTAGNYAILAKTGVSTIPTSVVTGNVGVSPAARVFLTGWSQTAASDGQDVYATSAQVFAPGKLYAADNAVPTPANLTTAVLNMEAAYTDAAGRPAGVGPKLNLGGGTVAGQTLTAGIYTWGSNVNITTDLTLNGSATDVWIFQIAGTLDMAANKNVILSGGALPQNIFWQVTDVVTMGAGTHFEGIILGKTLIDFGNLASINGRLLAQTAVTLDATTVTQP